MDGSISASETFIYSYDFLLDYVLIQ